MIEKHVLHQYTGTEHYFYDPIIGQSIKYTDGIKYLRDNGLNWFVFDTMLHLKGLMANSDEVKSGDYFLSIDMSEGADGDILFIRGGEDGDKILSSASYPISDYPHDIHPVLYFQNSVLFLSSEY